MKKIFFVPLFVFFFPTAFAQTYVEKNTVFVDSIQSILNFEQHCFVFADSMEGFTIEDILSQPFIPLNNFPYKNKIPRRLLLKPIYLGFSVQNISKSAKTYFFYPGMLYDKIALYRVRANRQLDKIEGNRYHTGFLPFTLGPGECVSYLAALEFSIGKSGAINAILVNPGYLVHFNRELANSSRDNRIASYILCGTLFMMILFVLVNYFLSFKIEFLYHCFYSISMFFLIFFSSYLSRRPGWFSAFFFSYFDLLLLVAGTIFYLAFIRNFLDIKRSHKILDKLFVVEIWLLVALMLVFSFVRFRTDNILLGEIIENSIKILALALGFVFIILGLKHKDKLMRYLAIGSAAQVFFFIISLFFIFVQTGTPSVFRSALLYFEIGIVMSVFFFLLGLTYKNRRDLIEKVREREAMKLEVEKRGFETQLAVIKAQQEERNRISEDMHDDLGAGMTSIRLFSELAKAKIGNKVIPEIEKISASADELLNKMNAIIWSMSSSNDSLSNMTAYIRSYALEYFENTGIDCKMSLVEGLPDLEVSGEIRRNIFLVVKEALNNIVKHAEATEVLITLQKEAEGLTLMISDNGKGIDFEKVRRFGNGLKNMKKRMEDVDMEFSIENNNGTTIKLYRKVRAKLS